jgi:uncharacterized membrane protein
MKRNHVNDIALLGITFALIAVLTFVLPRFLLVDLAFPLIPIFIIAELKGWKLGVISSTFYGLMSLINAFTTSTSPLRFVFQNPLVSVMPRIFVGLVVSLLFKFLYDKTKELKNKNGLKISAYVASFAGVLTNTILVLSMLYLFNIGKEFGEYLISLKTIFAFIISTNTAIELGVFPLLSAPIVYAIKKNQSIIIP